MAFDAADSTIRQHAPKLITVLGQNQAWHDDPPTPKQIALLKKLYPDKMIPSDLTKGQAGKLIDQHFAQFSKPGVDEMASPKQMGYLFVLRRQGKIASYPAVMTRRQAGDLIQSAVGKQTRRGTAA